MDDFVRDKLTEWGLSELIDTFQANDVGEESLFLLNEGHINKLIPKVGKQALFLNKLQMLKEGQGTSQGADAGFAQVSGPSSTNNEEKNRKKRLRESCTGQPSSKRHCEPASTSLKEAKILSDVKHIMDVTNNKLQRQDNTKLNDFLKKKIQDLKMEKRELVGVFGKTGAGKSSLINAVIEENGLLPFGHSIACTSVMINVEANMNNSKYEAEIDFIPLEEWNDELWSMVQFIGNKNQDNEDYRDINDKLSALYGKEWKALYSNELKEKSKEKLLDVKFFKEIPEFLKNEKKILICETAQELSDKISKYTKNDSNEARLYWPVVKCVTVRVPHNNFLQHVTLVDLPGNGDCNKSRDTMWKEILETCSTIWIVAEINRAASESDAWEIFQGAATSLIGNGGQCKVIYFICTKSDQFEDFQNHSAAEKQTLIKERNKQTKEEVKNQFSKQTSLRKHFEEDCFEVFTVSSKEFLMGNFLHPETTEIPKLQTFLQILNDSHSETINYVYGAQGILSLIEGARSRNAIGQNKEVCEDLERNLELQLAAVSSEMEKTYKAFDQCLSKGVQVSKRTCEEELKAFLYPEGKNGRGFHKTLKSVAQKNGIYKPKSGVAVNLNMRLTSSLTDSIDEKFRKTFPNGGKCGAFNGIITNFSLDIEELQNNYSEVNLQLTFLKTEEETMKPKLSKRIRDVKKEIYNSLVKTTEELMQEGYEKAADCSGKGTLKNMRETLATHVHESKNTMFEKAKTEMLAKLQALQSEILGTLENTMRESIELSLKTDDHSFPDVSAELDKVYHLYFELMEEDKSKSATWNP